MRAKNVLLDARDEKHSFLKGMAEKEVESDGSIAQESYNCGLQSGMRESIAVIGHVHIGMQ